MAIATSRCTSLDTFAKIAGIAVLLLANLSQVEPVLASSTDDDRRTVDNIEFLGSVEIPSGFEFEGTTVGGLSGIAYDSASGDYVAVSDDRVAPRFYELAIDLGDGSLDDGDVAITGVTALALDVERPDPEGIAVDSQGNFYISSERNDDGRFPQIFGVSRNGDLAEELDVDPKYAGLRNDIGVRNNLGFESLTLSPNLQTLFTATESALTQDGPRSSVDNGSAARIVRYDLDTGKADPEFTPVAEFVYEVDPIAAKPIPSDAFADSGLVELLAIDNQGTLLALERSFSIGAPDRGYTGKLYLARAQGATNVVAEESIPTETDNGELEINVDELVQKQLLVELGDFGIVVDNIEGMTFGPLLSDGRQSLIIVSDDNFSAFGPQATQFIALAVDLGRVPALEAVTETPDKLRYENE